MKKNLRNILVLSLGLITTIATAQYSAVNETVIDNTNSDDRNGFSRTTVSADWGGIHVSGDLIYSLEGEGTSWDVYEAYASTNLMGFCDVTMGQQDLSFGSGALMSSGSILDESAFGRYTTQGVNFSTSLVGMDVSIGMFDLNNESTYMNASGNFAGANVNVLMMSDAAGNKAHGYDLSYSMGDFTASASMNSDFDEDEMTSYGVSYSAMANLTLSAAMTEYEGDFGMGGTSANNKGIISGNMGGPGGLLAGDKNTSMGIAYNLGDITFGYTRHSVENDANDGFEANTMSIGYTLNSNCTLSIDRYADDRNTGDDVTLIGINITM